MDLGAQVESDKEAARAKERKEKEEKEKVERTRQDDLPPPPDLDIVSIVVLDGHGAILQPRLVVDKSVHHGGVQSLKFAYSISPPQSYLDTVGQPPKGVLVHEFPEGNGVSGGGNLSPRAGVTFAICRTLALVNEAQTKCAVRFETLGPFAIRRIEVVGYRPTRPPFSDEAFASIPNPKGLKGNAFMRMLNEQQSLQVARGPTQELSVPPKACVIVHLQFVAPPPREWGDKAITQISGKFLLHYPGGNEADPPLQRVVHPREVEALPRGADAETTARARPDPRGGGGAWGRGSAQRLQLRRGRGSTRRAHERLRVSVSGSRPSSEAPD